MVSLLKDLLDAEEENGDEKSLKGIGASGKQHGR